MICASRSAKRRAPRTIPAVEALEGRQLLSAAPAELPDAAGLIGTPAIARAYSRDFVGPRGPNSGVTVPAGGFATMMAPPPPYVSIHGSSPNSIGGDVGVNVMSGDWSTEIAEVKFEFDGAIEFYIFDVDLADYVPGTSETKAYPAGGYQPTSVAYGWNWDETVADRTIRVTTTYADPAATTFVTTFPNFDVDAPTVDDFWVEGFGHEFGTDGGYIGWFPNDAFWYEATVSDFPVSGELAIAQKIDAYWRSDYATYEEGVDYGAFVLDAMNWSATPYLRNYQASPSGDPYLFGDRYGAWDQPKIGIDHADMFQEGDKLGALDFTFRFEGYLMWIPTGGMPVAVAEVDHDHQGLASYTGGFDSGWYPGDFLDMDNWNTSVTHGGYWNEPGTAARSLVTWDSNAQKAFDEYWFET